MGIDPESEVTAIQRVAFVTRRFHELEGLVPASFGAALVVGALLQHAAGSAGRFGVATQALVFATVSAGAPAAVFLQRSYRRTFGDVATPYQGALGMLPSFVVMLAGTVDLFLQLDGRSSGPSLAAIAVTCYSAWVVFRDWPWRAHHLVGVAAGAIATVVSGSVAQAADRWGSDPVQAEVYLLAYTVIGLGLVVSGLFDHRLLASSLRHGGRGEPSIAPRAEWRGGLWRAWVGAVFGLAAAMCLFVTDAAAVLPMAVMSALFVVYWVSSFPRSYRAIRDFGKRTVVPNAGARVDCDVDVPVIVGALALAATLASVLWSAWAPPLLAVMIGASSTWLALVYRGGRTRYLLGTAAAAAALYFARAAEPGRALVILVVSIASAVALEGLLAASAACHREFEDADTV